MISERDSKQEECSYLPELVPEIDGVSKEQLLSSVNKENDLYLTSVNSVKAPKVSSHSVTVY